MNIIKQNFASVTGHRIPEKAIQKIALFALQYNPNNEKMKQELVIKILDRSYFTVNLDNLDYANIEYYISILQKCKCCKTHTYEKNMPFSSPVLTRQNATSEICKYCTCPCAFYIKELILY